MSDKLMRDTARQFACEGTGVRLVGEPRLGIAKAQIRVDDPDAWFEQALGVAAPAPLREIEPAPVACAWLAPGEWLVTGPEEDVERVRQRCASVAGNLGLMVDVTHARASYELSGKSARIVLASHCPLNFSEDEMPVGAAKRSIFSDAGLFVSRRPDRNGEPRFRLIFDQTMVAYVERLLGETISGNAL